MAKDPKETSHQGHSEHSAHAVPPRAHGATSYTVTFAGVPPCTVKAGSPEEAVELAQKELGVVSSEKAPEVVEVP